MLTKEKFVSTLGTAAAIMGVFLYIGFIDQARFNILGSKGSLFQPLSGLFNAVLWTAWGTFKKLRPVFVTNAIGIVTCLICAATAIWDFPFLANILKVIGF